MPTDLEFFLNDINLELQLDKVNYKVFMIFYV